MDYVWLIGTTLFVVVVGSVVFVVNENKEHITAWYITLLNEWEREDYVKKHRDALLNEMCHEELTIYIDKELDQVHAKKRELYAEMDRPYFGYMEESHEIAMLKGHRMPFNDLFVQKLIHEFSRARWLLLYALLGEARHARCLVTMLLIRSKQPRIDRKTRKQQRKQLALQ